MKRILHVSCGGLGYGGISTVIFSIVEELSMSFDFECVVFPKICGREELFKQYGKLHRIKGYSVNGKPNIIEKLFRPYTMYREIYRLCRDNEYDVIHCHNNFEEGICLLAAKKAGVKMRIAHSHNTPTPRKLKLYERLYESINSRLIQFAATKKIGCSDAACKAFFRDDNYEVICNSIDLNKFSVVNKQKHEGINFVHVGRYTYQKNQEFIVEVFNLIHNKVPETKLNLIGFGENEKMLQDLIKKLNLTECVSLLPGTIVDIPQLYRESDYMIFPSRYEGFGIVLIEAQASGVECFVSEAIQKEADAGGLHFLSLDDGARKWAEYICRHIHTKSCIDMRVINENLERFSQEYVGKQYAELYLKG